MNEVFPQIDKYINDPTKVSYIMPYTSTRTTRKFKNYKNGKAHDFSPAKMMCYESQCSFFKGFLFGCLIFVFYTSKD